MEWNYSKGLRYTARNITTSLTSSKKIEYTMCTLQQLNTMDTFYPRQDQSLPRICKTYHEVNDEISRLYFHNKTFKKRKGLKESIKSLHHILQ